MQNVEKFLFSLPPRQILKIFIDMFSAVARFGRCFLFLFFLAFYDRFNTISVDVSIYALSEAI